MNPNVRPVTADTLRKILQDGQEQDNALVRAFESVMEATKAQDGKPLGKRFLDQVQKTIPFARYDHVASMTYIAFQMDGQDHRIFLSYDAQFRTDQLREHNTPCTVGACNRTLDRSRWLADPQALDALAIQITAYNEARYALQMWEREKGHTFPDSLALKGLHDRD